MNKSLSLKKETPEEYRARKEYEKNKVSFQASLKKETPEEYKARKESQAQRTVKKETPEEYAARIDYIKKKEEGELKVETQRLFDKAEIQRYKHQNYLDRQEKKSIRECEQFEIEEYNKTPEGLAEQAKRDEEKAEKAERARIWNTPQAWQERKDAEEAFIERQSRIECKFARKHITSFGGRLSDSARRTMESGGIRAKLESDKKKKQDKEREKEIKKEEIKRANLLWYINHIKK
jgi:hypothetical protein